MAEHTVYMLKCGDGSLYTGYTNQLKNRLKMHQEGKGAKYTRGRGPFQVVYTDTFPSKQDALREEYRIKQLSRQEKLKMIRNSSKGGMQYEDTEELS
ncbi:GIY-YIG nuclease family protein [Virgibacillus xinjiangensis]|uniref:GIY-YIG nuclease family protein n=1 Tax=Virgibacillus xinjiangensis TaxID=393090 RepID=A0ABV7CY24_9BACI